MKNLNSILILVLMFTKFYAIQIISQYITTVRDLFRISKKCIKSKKTKLIKFEEKEFNYSQFSAAEKIVKK